MEDHAGPEPEDGASLHSCTDSVVSFTFNFEVVSSKAVGLEVEGQRRVGLIQEQVHPGQLDAVPLEHWTQDLPVNTQPKPRR